MREEGSTAPGAPAGSPLASPLSDPYSPLSLPSSPPDDPSPPPRQRPREHPWDRPWARRLASLTHARWLQGSAGALLVSRTVVLVTGIAAFLAFGNGPDARFDFLGLTGHLGTVGDALAAPVIHWDGIWYLSLAAHGYQHLAQAAFYPLYPLSIALLSQLTGSAPVAAFLISIASLLGALILLQRLTALELGEAAARRTVYLLALFPTAIFLSAAYPESLFLCLEVGALLAARRERWAVAGVLGGLGAATRNSGVLIVIPLALLYLYGPSTLSDWSSTLSYGRSALSYWSATLRALAPRRRLRPDALWLGLVFVGLAAVLALSLAAFGDPLAGWHAEAHWHRAFDGPLSALWQGIAPAVAAAGHLAAGHLSTGAVQKIALVVLALAAIAALTGVIRRLPVAYGAYSAVLLIWSLSAPEQGHPLASTPRYLLAIFPLFMWLGSRLQDRRKLVVVLALFTIGLVYCSVRFATWRWVA